jgi:hypothetical protein
MYRPCLWTFRAALSAVGGTKRTLNSRTIRGYDPSAVSYDRFLISDGPDKVGGRSTEESGTHVCTSAHTGNCLWSIWVVQVLVFVSWWTQAVTCFVKITSQKQPGRYQSLYERLT